MTKIYLPDVVGKGYATAWSSRKLYIVNKGGRGSKKSCTYSVRLLHNIMKYPLSNALVVRRYYNSHRDSTFAQLKWAAGRLSAAHLFRFKESKLEIIYKPTGQKILFKGLDDPDSLKSITVEVGFICWVWLEEAQQIQSESAFRTLALSIRGELPDWLWKQFVITFNPVHEKHWLKSRFFDEPKDSDDILAITTTYKCNEFLDALDVRRIESLPPAQYRVDGLGDWGVTEGLIYEQFAECNKDFIYTPPADKRDRPQFSSINIGIDWGDNKSAHAFVASGIVGHYGDIYVLKSKRLSAAGMKFETLMSEAVKFAVEVVAEFGPVRIIFCDHVNTYIESLRSALQSAGISASVTHAYKGRIYERIEVTRKLLAFGRLSLFKGNCESLENALNNAVWDAKKPRVRLDDGTVDVDTLDAFEYSWSSFIDSLTSTLKIIRRRD